MIVRSLILLIVSMGSVAMAHAQHDSVINTPSAGLAVERVITCGPSTDRKDPP